MDLNEISAFIALAAGLAGSYAKTQSDISKLQAEMNMGREREAEATRLMQDLTKTLHRIEKALVKGGLIDIE